MKNILNIMKTNKQKHGFQEKKRVPCEKSGRHSNPIYLVLTTPGRQSNPIYLILKPLKLQNFEFSTVPCLPCTANMQTMHVNCKRSTQHIKNNEAHL